MTRSGLIAVLGLILLAGITAWLKQDQTVPTARDRDKTVMQADFFLERFSMQQYNPEGRLEHQLYGQRLDHYPAQTAQSDERTEIQQPKLRLLRQDSPDWYINAQRGIAAADALDEIWLHGDVILQRPAADGFAPLIASTASLMIKPNANYVETNDTITITRPGAKIVAARLQADLNRQQMQLYQVNSRYEP